MVEKVKENGFINGFLLILVLSRTIFINDIKTQYKRVSLLDISTEIHIKRSSPLLHLYLDLCIYVSIIINSPDKERFFTSLMTACFIISRLLFEIYSLFKSD